MFEANKIRPLSLALIMNNNSLLVTKGYDKKKDEYFYRIPGGGIEFGERSDVALKREIREELGQELENLDLLGVFENIFEFEGRKGHEHIFVYRAEFLVNDVYKKKSFVILDSEEGNQATWEDLEFLKGKKLYPESLLKLIEDL